MTYSNIDEHSSKLFHSLSMNNLNKKDQHRKVKRLNKSILNLFPSYRSTKTFDKKSIHEQIQKENTLLQPPTTLATSELSRSLSSKSITFASIFDEGETNNTNNLAFDLGTSTENEDLVIVVPNKYVNNEPILNNPDPEPYPFRSELTPKFHSTTNIHTKKKSSHRLLRFHRHKQFHHSIKSIDQSKSTPNLFLSLSSPSTTTTTTVPLPSIPSNDQHQSLKTFRQWFKSSSFGRFIQSVIKHSNQNTTTTNSNTKHLKQINRVKSTVSRKYSDLIY